MVRSVHELLFSCGYKSEKTFIPLSYSFVRYFSFFVLFVIVVGFFCFRVFFTLKLYPSHIFSGIKFNSPVGFIITFVSHT